VRDRGTASVIMTPDMSRRPGLIGYATAAVHEMMRRNVTVCMSLTEFLARVQVRLFQ
jgi:hypothetical protein